MFPLKDNIPAERFPFINLFFIFINVLVFIYQVSLGQQLTEFIQQFGFVPGQFQDRQAENWLDLGRFIPVVTSMFLHGNLLHVFSNMWMLWIFGDNVEDSMGHAKYFIFYMLCGIAAVIVQYAFGTGSQIPMLGTSGAISGVLGAYFLLYPKARIVTLGPVFILFYLVEIPAFFFLGIWFFLQFLQGSVHWLVTDPASDGGGIAWWAHIGGFGAGFLLVHFFKRRKKHSPKRKFFLFS